MIKNVTLRCFRRHEDLTVDFSAGLNVLRGPNEKGKTTILEGVMYALYGTKALRDTLAETVTWGRKEAELYSRCVITVNKIDYVFTRSKAGAECVYAGPDGKNLRVTGQGEVSNFAAELLGADARTASSLMMASQNGLRGALEDGPAAVSGLMGKLADFDLIDKIVQKAEEQLALGSSVPLKAKLDEAEASLEALEKSVPEEGLADGFEELRANFADQIVQWTDVLASQLKPACDAAMNALAEAQQVHDGHAQLTRQGKTLEAQIQDLEAKIQATGVVAAKRPLPEALDKLRQRIEREKNQAVLIATYNVVATLPQYPVVFWDQPEESFLAELAKLRAEESRLTSVMSTESQLAASVRKGKITNGKCPTCGSVSRSDEHVATHNAEIEARAKVHDDAFNSASLLKSANGEEITSLVAVQRSAKKFVEVVASVGSHEDVLVDVSVYPPRVSWKGTVPSPVDVKVAKQELASLEAAVRDADVAKGKLDSLVEQKTAAAHTLLDIVEKQAAIALPDMDPLRVAYAAAQTALQEGLDRVDALKLHEAGAARQRDEAKRAYESAKERLEATRNRIVEYRDDIRRLEFNNGLVTKLKKLKPAITDSLWNNVLAAVSNFFSTLRNEPSVVTKEANGFKVNGKSIDSLSGSTIDVLALAIRVALTKTFIPHASFMVLDEPAHGCDNDRTAGVLGFLSSVGFQQTILASHDELSESVADNVVSLGA